jgi:hypothetical protein
MLDVDPPHGLSRNQQIAPTQAVQAALTAVHAKIIGLITTWVEANERYADLRSRCRSPSAYALVMQVCEEIEKLEHQTGGRVRKRRARSAAKFSQAVERIIGDLLRARGGNGATGRIYRATGKSSFTHDPVKYDVFWRVAEGLKALDLIGHSKGQTRYRKTGLWPDHAVTVPGRAARFWATAKLVTLAASHRIHAHNLNDHFAPEPPQHPLVLRDYATGRGVNKERGRIIRDYERTAHTEKLAADVRELNEFLGRYRIEGARHDGYTRNFNLGLWDKGGRLYSLGEGSYQQTPEHKRHAMTINGEPVAEIDIKASYLTIYHARLHMPLDGSSDPYLRAGVGRDVAKLWCVASFGNSKPTTQWPADMASDYLKDTGQELRKVAKARDVARTMLKAFPALQKLKDHNDIWADLQFLEAEAVIGTMLILMRSRRVPSLSMHDGLIVPRSKAELAKTILAKEYRRVVGVAPMLTAEPKEETVSALDL